MDGDPTIRFTGCNRGGRYRFCPGFHSGNLCHHDGSLYRCDFKRLCHFRIANHVLSARRSGRTLQASQYRSGSRAYVCWSKADGQRYLSGAHWSVTVGSRCIARVIHSGFSMEPAARRRGSGLKASRRSSRLKSRSIAAWIATAVVSAALLWALYLARGALLLIYISVLLAIALAPLTRMIANQTFVPLPRGQVPQWLAILVLLHRGIQGR